MFKRRFLLILCFTLMLSIVACNATALTADPSADPTMSRVHIITYRPDGTIIALPVTLTNVRTNAVWNFNSGEVESIAAGSYDIKIDIAVPYVAQGITFVEGAQADIPVTLSEVQFSTTPTYQSLIIRDRPETIMPNKALLVAPGNATLELATGDLPDATQLVAISLMPGQHQNMTLKSELFGSGTLQVHIAGPDGKPFQAGVNVYSKDKESGKPYASFASDDPPVSLPEGDYVVNVLTQIANRSEQHITRRQNVDLTVKLGTATITAKDSSGNKITPAIYIVSSDEMSRLKLPIDQTFLKASQFGLYLTLDQTLTLPEGNYSVMISGVKESAQDFTVTGGQTTSVELKGK